MRLTLVGLTSKVYSIVYPRLRTTYGQAPLRHLWIPDTQVRSGVCTDHIEALGNYIEEKRFEKIIVAGDWWDMPATSNFNSPKDLEGLRVLDDIDSGNRAMHKLWWAVDRRNKRYSINKKKQYRPECHFLMGNHEAHLERLWQKDPRLEGIIGYDSLALDRFNVHDFLKIVDIDGILYSHYFCNPMSGRPWGGMIETRIKNVGQSFTQGHAQSFKYGELEVASGKRRFGLVSGAFYMHDEDYKGPQGNQHWRGVVVKNDVSDGQYDIMKISLDYLLRKYL